MYENHLKRENKRKKTWTDKRRTVVKYKIDAIGVYARHTHSVNALRDAVSAGERGEIDVQKSNVRMLGSQPCACTAV